MEDRMPDTNTRVLLKTRPVGAPTVANFELVEAPVPKPGAGEVLCRTIYLSLDPYMRGRISGARSYATPVEVGEVIVGGTVSQVVESSQAGLAPGDFVAGSSGWQAF